MTKKQKKTRTRIVTALVLFLALELAEHLAPDALYYSLADEHVFRILSQGMEHILEGPETP